MKENKYLTAKREQFREMYPTNKNVNRLAQKIGVSSKIIAKWQREDFEKKGKKERFKALYPLRKYTREQLAEKIGVSVSTIANWRRELYPKGNNWRYLKFCKLAESGAAESVEEIADYLKISHGSVLRYLRQYLDEMQNRDLSENQKIEISALNPHSFFKYLLRNREKLAELANKTEQRGVSS